LILQNAASSIWGMMMDRDSKTKALDLEADRCAGFLKALGDPNRLRIMQALRSSPLTVTDLSLLLEVELPNVSHHLRVLFHAGLVTTRKDGKFKYYQIDRQVVRNKAISADYDLGCCRLQMRS
jgi:DNA-binding transcriptional ArsR family regulator